MDYDYLVVGTGLYGATFAQQAIQNNKRVLVLEKRAHIGGNAYTEEVEGIQVHRYGAHIFHTQDRGVWDYVNCFGRFNSFINSPIAKYHDEVYALPFNMHSFNRLWGVITPQEAEEKIAAQRRAAGISSPRNLEEQAICLVGKDIYEKLIRGYTEKQWGRACSELPAFIIKRLPIRFTYDTNYYDARYQGIPEAGYTKLVENMLAGADVRLNTDYLAAREHWNAQARQMVYTGPLDAYFDYCFGALEYRSLRFDTQILGIANYQGNAVVNYTDSETPWTRIIEHKWFAGGVQPKTVITREYSAEWKKGSEPYYPINDEKNDRLFMRYRALALKEKNTLFGGRLGDYRYYDMDGAIRAALDLWRATT